MEQEKLILCLGTIYYIGVIIIILELAIYNNFFNFPLVSMSFNNRPVNKHPVFMIFFKFYLYLVLGLTWPILFILALIDFLFEDEPK